jgi:hypothetical protein
MHRNLADTVSCEWMRSEQSYVARRSADHIHADANGTPCRWRVLGKRDQNVGFDSCIYFDSSMLWKHLLSPMICLVYCSPSPSSGR